MSAFLHWPACPDPRQVHSEITGTELTLRCLACRWVEYRPAPTPSTEDVE